MDECLICGSVTDLTVEHIIPQSLWKRLRINPNGDGDIAKTRTTLCGACNKGTSQLHGRDAMLNLIVAGGPVTRQTLQHLADWTFWVTLLLGLANRRGVVDQAETRALLRARFRPGNGGGIPTGLRIYAGKSADLGAEPESPVVPYAIALVDDKSVYLDAQGHPIGHQADAEMSLQAAEAIGLGTFVLLVVARTHTSGADHTARLDAAAETAGLARIHPLRSPIPDLSSVSATVIGADGLFVREPLLAGANLTLLPENIRRLV